MTMPGPSSPANTGQSVSVVMQEIENQDKQIACLHEQLDHLFQRLQPIRGSAPAAVTDPQPEVPVEHKVSQLVGQNTRRLATLTAAVEHVRNELEV